ncbi:hypothetical protein PPYR_01104 [Photinus pyralis]|uniref:Uncharacterized protein n=1 Tax=Photinus pyralis TaxID=7054 RepID=A0A1Y1NL31_PHOPY|nr:uncharacterized protein LOC116175589 [Photinus pyralis]XP_031349648.1 uncharacterized protein LOC116175589 [Photinus pyralis]KAB0804134.1 hypothetical protein PPYR_01104 [Photinus pyralis]
MSESSESSASSSDEDSYDLFELQDDLIYKETQRRKELKKLPVIPRCKLKKAIKRLKEDPKKKYDKLSPIEKRAVHMKKTCTNNKKVQDRILWGSPTYLMRAIKNCILTRNWNNLSLLLLLLLRHNRVYRGFVKQMTLWNFMCNPDDYDNQYFNDLVHLCKIK